MNRTWMIWGIALSILTLILVPAGEHLLLGWVYLPIRVLPKITVEPWSLGLGCISVALFVGGLHLLLKRLTVGRGTKSGWPWRATAAVSAIVLLLFVAGISMVGATHQIIWIFSRDERNRQPVFGITDVARGAAQRDSEHNNLKMIGLGVQNFHDTQNVLPPGGTMTDDGELLHGWAVFILPYMTTSTHEIDFSIPWNRPQNARFFKCNLREFVNPALNGPYFDDRGYGLAQVAGNSQLLRIQTLMPEELRSASPGQPRFNHSVDSPRKQNLTDVSDGASNTLLVGTVEQGFKPWGHPTNLRDPASGITGSAEGFGGPTSWKGAMFVYNDGRTAMISDKIDPRVLKQLASPTGGEAEGAAD